MHEQGARPGLEAVGVAQRIELLAGDQLEERGLDGVLEVVLVLWIASPAQRQPVTPEGLQHGAEARIGRPRLCRAQDAENGFRRPGQHVIVSPWTLTDAPLPGQGSDREGDTLLPGGTSLEQTAQMRGSDVEGDSGFRECNAAKGLSPECRRR